MDFGEDLGVRAQQLGAWDPPGDQTEGALGVRHLARLEALELGGGHGAVLDESETREGKGTEHQGGPEGALPAAGKFGLQLHELKVALALERSVKVERRLG